MKKLFDLESKKLENLFEDWKVQEDAERISEHLFVEYQLDVDPDRIISLWGDYSEFNRMEYWSSLDLQYIDEFVDLYYDDLIMLSF